MSARALALSCAAAAFLFALGCGDRGSEPTAPRWIPLARALEVERTPDAARALEVRSGRALRWLREGGQDWIELPLARSDFARIAGSVEPRFAAEIAVRPAPAPRGVASQTLISEDGAIFRYAAPDWKERRFELPPGSFAAALDRVFLAPHAGSELPAHARLRIYAGSAASDAVGRFAGHQGSGDGVALAPGDRAHWRGAVPPQSALRFAACVEPLLARAEAPREPTRLRVRIGGALAFDEAIAKPGEAAQAWHEVALPAAGAAELAIDFELEGGFARAAVAAPGIGPASGSELARRARASDPRPDLVLFLADTFRADNLAPYGDSLELAPFLSQLSQQGRLFRRAWSVSSHTLPAHAALFTGLQPHRAGISSQERPLGPGVATLAEELAARGYRTGAITDSVFVSQRYGLDRGFEWFHEQQSDFASTRRRALSFLDADDGRPLFLFLHSYRTHLPYRVSDETRRARGVELGIDASFEALIEAAAALDAAPPADPGAEDAARLALAARIRALYRGTVVDLDRELRGLYEELARRGLFERGVFAFTSDHGEAFHEHGRLFHGGPVHEEAIRIPLFLLGRGIEPAVVDDPVSLVDLTPTLASLAGIPARAEWSGRSLLAAPAERALYAFESAGTLSGTLALLRGGRKVIGFEDPAAVARGEIYAAYDLGVDPGERNDLAASGAEWPAELLAANAAELSELLRPAAGAESGAAAAPVPLDPQLLEQLRELGYAK